MSETLRALAAGDQSRLRELLSLPDVCEFMSDGSPPPLPLVEDWVTTALAAKPPFGLWLLGDGTPALLGCVRLSEVEDGAASAELMYALHPSAWGRGLATAMSRSALARAFEVPSCESVLAGADVPNTRSVQVMQRLGMRLLRNVEYPAGAGVEYVLERSAFEAMPPGPSVPFA